jgi:hypothetical protein
MQDFETWLRSTCFQQPTKEAEDLARAAWKAAEAHAPQQGGVSNSSDVLDRKAFLNGEFRMIISHRLMGYECDMEKADFDGMIADLVDKTLAD